MTRFFLAVTMFAAAVATMSVGTMAVAEPSLAEAGKKHFIRCVACHTMSADARPGIGPHLEGIVGRQSAAVEGFKYTDAMRAHAVVWDEATLDAWLEAPQADVPGLCLPFTGLRKADDRAALIAYLKGPAP